MNSFKDINDHIEDNLKILFKNITIDNICEEIIGELPEITARGMDGHFCYGNRELIFFSDYEEEAVIWYVDIYGDRKILVQG